MFVMESSKPYIIGITGYAGAGKDSFAGLLEQQLVAAGKSVSLVSSGDLIRAYVKEHGLGDIGDRAVLRQAVDDVAKTESYTFWLERAIESASVSDVLLYPGLRQTVEVDLIHRRQGIAIAIDAPIETRYTWAQSRARQGDNIDFETFKANEEAERAGSAQQLDNVVAKADVVIANDGTLEQLEQLATVIARAVPGQVASQYRASEQVV